MNPLSKNSFWGIPNHLSIEAVEQKLKTVVDTGLQEHQQHYRQLEMDVETNAYRIQRDEEIAQNKTERANQIEGDHDSNVQAAIRKNQLLYSGARELEFVSTEALDVFARSPTSDRYFLVKTQWDERTTYALNYIDQNGVLHPNLIPANKQDAFDHAMQGRDVIESSSIRLTHDEFVEIITRPSIVDPDNPAAGHYSTSWEGQYLKADLMREAAYGLKLNQINTDFVDGKNAAIKKNALLHSGKRELQFTSEDELAGMDLTKHKDEYFLIKTVQDEGVTYALHYVDPNGAHHPIRLPENGQNSFNRAIGRKDFNANENIVLSHVEFIALITTPSITDNNNPGNGHFSTSWEGQYYKADLMRAAAYKAQWNKIGQDFKTSDEAAIRTNKLLHSGARELRFLSAGDFQNIELADCCDEYFVVRGNDNQYALHYVDQDGAHHQDIIPEIRKYAFSEGIRQKNSQNAPSIVLSHQDFVALITDLSIIDEYDPAAGHFSTSWEGQYHRADLMRAAAYKAQRRQIRQDFDSSNAAAIKKNALLYSGARKLQFKSENELAGMDLTLHKDEYFLVKTDRGRAGVTYALHYVEPSGLSHQIIIPEDSQGAFDREMRRREIQGETDIVLSHNDFISFVTNPSITDANNPEGGHFSTSWEGQYYKAGLMRAAAYKAQWNQIGQDFKTSDEAAIRTNKLLYNGARELRFLSAEQFQSIELANCRDEYFVVKENEGQYALHYVDQNGAHHQNIIPPNQQPNFNNAMQQKDGGNNGNITLSHDEFVRIITNPSITDTNNPAAGHFSTSWDGQYYKANLVRNAAYQAQWNQIGRDFDTSNAAAIKRNALLHSGSRKLQFTSADDFDRMNSADHTDEYFLVKTDQAGDATYTLHYVDSTGQRIRNLIPASRQDEFNGEVGLRDLENNQDILISHDDFVRYITSYTITDESNPGAGHFSTSREGQRHKANLVREAVYNAQWRQIGSDLDNNIAAANRTNNLLHSGARSLEIVEAQDFERITAETRSDEYFLVKGADNAYTLAYFDPNGILTNNLIVEGKQQQFQDAIVQQIEDGALSLTLTNQQFIDIVTNNSFESNPANVIPDNNVDKAHFNTSYEAQQLRSERIRQFEKTEIAQVRFNEDRQDNGNYKWRMTNNRQFRAVAVAIGVGAYKIGRACLYDFPKWLAGNIGRNIYAAGEFVCSQLTRVGRQITPYLEKYSDVAWYGIKKGTTAVGRTVYGAAEFICSQLARGARRIAPYADAALNAVLYGANKAISAAARPIYYSIEQICSQLMRAGRRMAPYLAGAADLSWYGIKKGTTAIGRNLYGAAEQICSQLARVGRRITPYFDSGIQWIGYGIKKGAAEVENITHRGTEQISSQLARVGRRVEPYLTAGANGIAYGIGKGASAVGRTIYRPAEQICSQMTRYAREIAPYPGIVADLIGYGIAKGSTAVGRTIYAAAEQICSQLARVARRVTPYIGYPFAWAEYYGENAWGNTKRFFTRNWYDLSPFRYVSREEGIEMLFSDSPQTYSGMPNVTGYSRDQYQRVNYGQLEVVKEI